jgi:hypothetical protein
LFEELIHAKQFQSGVTVEAGRGGVLRFEAEAAENLIQNRQAWQLPRDEVRQVVVAKFGTPKTLLAAAARPPDELLGRCGYNT